MLHTILLTCCSWEFWLVQFFEDLTDFHPQLGSHREKQKVEDLHRLRLLRGFHVKSNASLSLKMMKNMFWLLFPNNFPMIPLLRFKFTHFSLLEWVIWWSPNSTPDLKIISMFFRSFLLKIMSFWKLQLSISCVVEPRNLPRCPKPGPRWSGPFDDLFSTFLGVGYCAVFIAYYVSFYYNVIIGWSIYYFANSLYSSGSDGWIN